MASDFSAAAVPLLKSIDELDPVAPLDVSKLKTKVQAGRVPAIVVACGSFSPVTVMHLRILEDARDSLDKESNFEVIGGFISCTHDAYGKKSLAPMVHRLNMTALALADSEWISLDTWECAQSEWTRTALVLRDRFGASVADVAVQVGDSAPTTGIVRVLYLCGADVLSTFNTVLGDGTQLWSTADQEAILSGGVAVIERQDIDLSKLIDETERLSAFRKNIHTFSPATVNSISSTVVRSLLSRNQSIKYLVPENSRRYIYENKLHLLPQWC